MSPELLLEHAAAVQAAHDGDRERLRRKLARLDARVSAGDAHLAGHRASVERHLRAMGGRG